MANPVNVLVVDDAVVVRRIVTDVLSEDADIRVVGTAANGRIALQKLTQLQPDIVTLDIEMPEMNGLETLKALRVTHPRLPVIMFSTLTQRGAAATLDALSFGASDYVTKPANVGSVAIAQQRIREELIPKIKALSGRAGLKGGATPMSPSKASVRPAMSARGAIRPVATPQVLVVGVSTGGPNALAEVVPDLPGDLPVPVFVVQHMPPMFTRLLAERLDRQCALAVSEAIEGQVVRPGMMVIAPGDYHLTIERRGHDFVTHLNREAPENSCRPAVDVLFRSAVAACGNGVFGLVMTGMGQDGLRGCERIHEAGGVVVVQDEASSVVWGMPGFVANAGLAEAVVGLDGIANEISRRCGVRMHKAVAQ